MDQTLSARLNLGIRLLLLAALLVGLLDYVLLSFHWPVVWDAAVMHYVVFLMDHGLRPYRDITDSNLPGAYIVETVGMHLFGRGDVAWRLFDLFLCGSLTLASVEIARRVDWVAGVFAGLFFTLLHGSDGPRFTGERDLVMTVLLVCGLACLLRALRGWSPWWMALFGLAGGIAASIKPTSVPLAAILLVAVLFWLRRDRQSLGRYVAWTMCGVLLSAAIVIGFLVGHHAFGDFFFVMTHLLGSYVSLNQLGAAELLRLILPRSVVLLTVLGVLLAFGNRRWTPERTLVLIGLAFGALSYFSQRKGYPYHRYPLVAFLFLFLAMEILGALRRSNAERSLAALAVGLFVLVTEPHMLHPMRAESHMFPVNFTDGLTGDLAQMGPDRLQRNVQCFDLTYGCFSALYHLGVLQSNGFTGDLLFFSPTPSAAAEFYRSMFWRLNAQRPTDVLVITNQWFQENNTFAKLGAWPAFDAYLRSQYVEVTSRSFPVSDGPIVPGDPPQPAYRIYVRKGSAFAREPESGF